MVKSFRSDSSDLICLSHLRWDFVVQRPQHLLSRAARERRVFFVEEPMFDATDAWLEIQPRQDNLSVIRPHLHASASPTRDELIQQRLLDEFLVKQEVSDYWLWYYTPMALGFTSHLQPRLTVYDCMDELSGFRGAPPELLVRETELFRRADLVFTGGQSLYQAKHNRHARIYPFPSSVDKEHFAQARVLTGDPADQAQIPHPRLGFFGVIDERMDLELVAGIAAARPEWHIVLVGPVVKIDPAMLPQHPNIHYLGGKSYDELPLYLAGWDVALLPFARNESTRFISPTKTPEYLAGGKPVVSTRITDVVQPYGELGLVQIADTVPDFVNAIEAARAQAHDRHWLARVDDYLARLSWQTTWQRMSELIRNVLQEKDAEARHVSKQPYFSRYGVVGE